MKSRIAYLIVALMAIAQATAFSANPESREPPAVIPSPSSMAVSEGSYKLGSLKVYVQNDAYSADLLEMLECKLGPATGYQVQVTTEKKADIRFVEDGTHGPDGYALEVGRKGVKICASSYGGHFYGLQTLLQLLPAEIKSQARIDAESWEIPFVQISDAPRFAWRGLMLDVSRHWFTKEEVMRYIDEMAEYKYNVFHWHLTDDQGWRIQIDSCPELTAKGSMRATRIGGDWWKLAATQPGEPLDYGGYYTKADIKEVVEYAAKRNISVMPEIDVPGHSLATLVAYPELACLKAPEYVNVGNEFYGKEENALCPGNEKTFEFLDKVFREVAKMFPFEYIHIGGDECYRGFWGECPKCAARMEEEKIYSRPGLQSYFIKRVEKIVDSYGKKIVGWDEISEGGLAEKATVMSWRGMNGGIEAAKAGHHVIMTPIESCYLDLYQGEKTAEPNTYRMVRLSDCYAFEPVPEGVDPSLVLGGQGNLWTEAVPVFRHAEYMTWPRGWALSEVLWSPKDSRGWDDFMRRTEQHFRLADIADINYAHNSVYNAVVTVTKDADGQPQISLGSELSDVEIFYTWDNTVPDRHSARYDKPFGIPASANKLKIQSYRAGAKVGTMLNITVEDLMKRAK